MSSALTLRSILFVPGDRPERFARAFESGADAVCVDLEDAVQPTQKAAARRNVLEAASSFVETGKLFVRINNLRSEDGLADLLALASAAHRPSSIIVPKIESAQEVQIVRAVLSRPGLAVNVVGLVETLAGLDAVDIVARQTGVVGLILGTADLSAEMGTSMEWEPMMYARQRLVFAAQRARIAAVDGAWTRLDDPDGLYAETARAAGLGFGGKLCLHPRQVTTVHAALLPSQDAIEYARDVIAADAVAPHGVTVVRGRMVDRPIVEAARRTLAKAGLGG